MNRALLPLITEEESDLPFYVKSVGGWENQMHMARPLGYQEFHWLHCLQGKGRLLIGSAEYIIGANMGFFFRPGIPHEYYPVDSPWKVQWVTFDGYAVLPLLDKIGLREWNVFDLSDLQTLEALVNEIFILCRSENPNKGYDCSALLYKFLMVLKNCISTGDNRLKASKRHQLQPVISYMERNFCTDPTLEEMSALLQITPHHLCRLFKQTFNMRPFTYLTKLRLQKAKELMIGLPCLPVKEVAQKVGYNDTSYFCSIFKENEGMTPLEYKRMHHLA